MGEQDDNANANALTFLLGIVSGVIVGVVLGVLFTPQSGSESRADIRNRTLGLRERARNIGETGNDALRDAISEGRDAAMRAGQDMQDWIQHNRGDGSAT
ncbi:MAG: YtxH domain-containing protein [Chloroflexi bacterium]|nr:YtxH domain-containing protein [Chloroflexota bacterium]